MFLLPYRDDTPSRSLPILTLLLIAANTYIFIRTGASIRLPRVVSLYGFTTEAALQRPYVLVTSMFLHGNLLHLVSNMWFLWLFGDNIEDRFGRLSFLALYLSAGVTGNFFQALFSLFDSSVPVIGASGAVAGVMGSYLVRFPAAKIRTIFFLIIYPIFFRLYAAVFIGMWMLGEFIAAWLSPHDFVAHWAHIGGFCFGFIWTYGRRDKPFYKRRWWG